jgi:beta-lactamase regulating signal transducer with metallopeptidase domain
MMISNVVHLLVATTLASSIAVVLAGAVRKPLRHTVGARGAYWIWVLVPASLLAVCVPGPSDSAKTMAGGVQNQATATLSNVMFSVDAAVQSSNYAVGAVAVWLVGAIAMVVFLAGLQWVFVRRLKDLIPDLDGICQSRSVGAPLLIGIWHPQIVVPVNFDAIYSPEERALVLAHERAHAARRDIAINALASAWLCFAWFNPVMYWALGRLRFDQDLACDAIVLATSRTSRSCYAKALLKTQLANESGWRMPIGCHWQSTHPLKERIAMLKHPFAGTARRSMGIVFSISVAIGASYTAWAAQPDAALPGTLGRLIAVDMKWWVNGTDVLPGGSSSSHDIRVVSGKEFIRRVSLAPGQSYETRCFASLSNEDRASPIWNTAKTLRKQGTDGLILLECQFSNDDKVFSTPALLVGDGKVGTIETNNAEGTVHYKLEFNASTQLARTVVAK